jgi:hypothetical protein
VNNPLWVNDPFRTAARKQPLAEIAKLIVASAAMLTGGMIYVLWRSESLLMFSWFDALGIGPTVRMFREHAAPHAHALPHFIVFSLPQALWLFSGILFFRCIWPTGSRGSYMLWTGVFVAIAFGFELGQLLNVVPGCFEVGDALSLIAACLLALPFVSFTSHWERRVHT